MKETVCCFFGHHNAKDEIKEKLCEQVRSLIVNENAKKFYVGTHGNFDYLALLVLREMKKEFPDIDYTVVLAYMPDRSPDEYSYFAPEETLFPDGLEKSPRRLAIIKRNEWMLKQSDTVVCYVWHFLGGAGSMVEKAERKRKRIINIAKM